MALPTGFGYKQFGEIKAEIENSLVKSLGEINLLAPSIFANIVAIFAEREANLWEQLQAVYNASHPGTAEGYSLDGICALSGVMRSNYTYSVAICQLTAIAYTKIPKNSMVAVKNSLSLFALIDEVTITNEKCQSIKLEVKNNTQDCFNLTINQTLIKFDKQDGQTKEDIATCLITAINDKHIGLSATCNSCEIIIIANDFMKEFSCFVHEGIAILECTNNAYLKALDKGAIAAPINSLSSIHTPISGWIGCNNLTAAKIGNNRESDQALRYRREQSIKLGGSGTLEAIRASLLNLNTVSAVSIFENQTTMVNEEGLPPHSFEVLITGGEDFDIARILWQKKPVGIKTHGNISVAVLDSENRTQILNFSRPAVRFIYGKITITKTKDFSEFAAVAIKAKLVNQINNLGVGSNVILKSLFLSIFSENAIANACIKLGSSTDEISRSSLKKSDIIIKANEVALTDALKIEIILEDF